MKKKTLICTLIATAIVVATVAIGCSYSASQNGDNETNESEQVTTVNDSEQATTVTQVDSEQATTVNDSEIKSDATEKETKVENNTEEETQAAETEEASKEDTQETTDPFKIETSGSHTDKKLQGDDTFTYYLRTFENGAQRYMLHVHSSIVNKYYTIEKVGVIPDSVSKDIERIANEYNEQHKEEETTKSETKDPFKIEPSGSYTDTFIKSTCGGDRTYYLRTFENGAQRYVLHAKFLDILNKYYYVDEVGGQTAEYNEDIKNAIKSVSGETPTQTPTQEPTQAPTQAPTQESTQESTQAPNNALTDDSHLLEELGKDWGKDPGNWGEVSIPGDVY